MSKIDTIRFRQATGYWPVDDDLERSNCDLAGTVGHFTCGWDEKRNMPNFIPSPKRPWWKFWA